MLWDQSRADNKSLPFRVPCQSPIPAQSAEDDGDDGGYADDGTGPDWD